MSIATCSGELTRLRAALRPPDAWVLAHACVRASAVYVDRIWKFLMVLTHSESPVVVVLSGSMEPAFQRGDILFLWLGNSPFRVGEIVVFKIEGRDIPIVHRVIKVHEKRSMYYSD